MTSTNQKPSSKLPMMLVSISGTVIVLAVIAGVVLSGGPFYQRQIRFDEERLNRLDRLSRTIENYYHQKDNQLPADLEDARGYTHTHMNASTTNKDFEDPDTGHLFEYLVMADSEYKLCAVFTTSNLENDERYRYNKYSSGYRYYGRIKGIHPEGHHCYEFKLKPKKK